MVETDGARHARVSGEHAVTAGSRKAATLPPRIRHERTECSMDLGKLAERAKGLVAKRGGTDSLKKDAEELKDIAGGDDSAADKAKAAAEAVRDPGAPGEGR
jgi:hypothetical protein